MNTAHPAYPLHRSVAVPLSLATAMLPVRDGLAWLCAVFLCVQVGDLELSMSAECAALLLDALSTLLTFAGRGVTR